MRFIILFSCFFFISSLQAENLDLDQLLKAVKNNQSSQNRINKARESRFLTEKNKQQQLLKSARQELAKQESLSQTLKQQLDSNEEELSSLETELKNRSGVLGELFGVARQAAGDLKADLNHSIISAQFPGRIDTLETITDSKALPTIDQLENLWYTLQHEMTESGKVVYYSTEIEQASGKPENAKVIRIGNFNTIAKGQYLQYSAENGRLTVLPRQPEAHYLSKLAELEKLNSGQAAVGVDPTRGVILSMLIQAPNTLERINQGGHIGYGILIMGAAGFLFACYRLIYLSLTGHKLNQQLESDEISLDNPLGRVFSVAEQNQHTDFDNLELILDEAITREVPKLEKGLSMIKLLAAVAPLLGLLGTVTGMIATFQSISLFGTGDPKLMASGISQALVTTMLGLCVAVPLLFIHSLVSYRSRTLVQILDEQSAGLVSQRLEKNHKA